MSKETNKGITAYRDGDYATALAEFTSLAKAGNAKAQYYLGLMHDNGYGTPQNYAEAAKCYRPAAEAGIAEAQYALGLIYLLGKGVIESDAITYVWFSLATAQGLKIAEKKRNDVARFMSAPDMNRAQEMAQEIAKKYRK